MAQAGYTPISLYHSTTASAVPVAGNLIPGELAININDGKLYFENSSGVVTLLAQSGASSPVTTFSAGTTGLTPSTATSGAITLAGTLATTNGGTGLTSFSANQLFFASSSSAIGQSANLTWNGTLLSTTGFTASSDSSFTSTGALTISKGTTLQQPGAPVTGMMRYNSTTNQFEGYSGAAPAWKSIGGSALSNDTATATDLYPVFAAATTGTAENLYTSNAKYLYKPSTGELQASALVSSNGIVVNSQTISTSYTIAAGNNAMSTGPVTVASGQTVTVASGSRWVVL
jgi:hypothetical protein